MFSLEKTRAWNPVNKLEKEKKNKNKQEEENNKGYKTMKPKTKKTQWNTMYNFKPTHFDNRWNGQIPWKTQTTKAHSRKTNNLESLMSHSNWICSLEASNKENLR